MTILRKLFEFKLSVKDLLQIYKLYIRSIVEQNCVVWGSSITNEESKKIERVQKIALRIIFRENYLCYKNALELSNLPTLSERRSSLSLKFALKCVRTPYTSKMFPLNSNRHTKESEAFHVEYARTERFKRSAIPTMARQLNDFYRAKK